MVRLDAYTDAAMCIGNPSPFGAGWAVVYVPEGAVYGTATPAIISGRLTPEDFGFTELENNSIETFAVLQALVNVPPGYQLAAVYTDSKNAKHRAQEPHQGKWAKVPPFIRQRMKEVRAGHRRDNAGVRFELVGGHPTRADLARGYRLNADGSRGANVSGWNKEADKVARAECIHLQTLLGLDSKTQRFPNGQPKEVPGIVLPGNLSNAADQRPA